MSAVPSPAPPPSALFPLRVAHLLRPAAGGMQVQVRSLLDAAPAPPLLAAPDDVLQALSDVVADPDDRFFLEITHGTGVAAMLRRGADAGRWAQRRDAALLHGHGLRFAPLYAAAARAARRPLVVTLHNLVPPELSWPARAVLRTSLRRARRVLAVSEAVAQSARPIVRTQRITVVRSGVDAARFVPAGPERRAGLRRALELDPCDRVVLCVARLSPEKDVGAFLEAAAIVARQTPEARFLVAGDGPLLPALRHQAGFLGIGERVRLLGRRDDVPDLLAAADVLCQPSREEGLGLAILEAMASGLPVVATNVGGIPEIVAANETGLLVPTGSPVALADALVILLRHPDRARTMGAAGRARVAAQFTLDRMIAATHAEYARALAR